MEQERKNHNILLTIIGVMTLLIAMIGATFAYFSATYTAKPQNIKTGELKINAESTIENNTNIKPTSWLGEDESELNDEIKKDIATVTLTVNTEGTTIDKAYYNIFLSATGIKLNETQVQVSQEGTMANREGGALKDIKWSLFDEENYLGSGDFESVPENGEITDLKVNQQGEIPITPEGDSSHVYKLYIWIQDTNEKQDKLQNLDIKATLRVDAKQGTESE